MIKRLIHGLIDLIYPPVCILCRTPIPSPFQTQNPDQLCLGCHNSIPKNRPPFCAQCSRPLQDPSRALCKYCQRTDYYFDYSLSACLYNPTMQNIIHLFKYGRKTALRHTFTKLMINFLNDYHFDLKDFDLIVPVPLHPWRLYKRGFNQSLLLADLISAHLGIPISSNNLIRGHYTKNQAKISKKERWTNIQGAFKIKSSCEFVDKNILIIDDLMTTGATTSEIARVLKGAGAQKVCVLTPAITMKTD